MMNQLTGRLYKQDDRPLLADFLLYAAGKLLSESVREHERMRERLTGRMYKQDVRPVLVYILLYVASKLISWLGEKERENRLKRECILYMHVWERDCEIPNTHFFKRERRKEKKNQIKEREKKLYINKKMYISI